MSEKPTIRRIRRIEGRPLDTADGRFWGVLALIVVVGFLLLVGALIVVEVPEANQSIVFAMVGSVAALVGTIVGYRWGTSQSSERKTELMREGPRGKSEEGL